MKRSWLGVGILAALLVSGILSTWALTEIHEPGARQLEQAAELAAQDRWAEAEALTKEAKEGWEKRRHLVASLVDHEPIEELEAQLARLDAFLDERDRTAFRAQCLYLARAMEALGEANQLKLWNLL